MKTPFLKIAEDLGSFPELVECADDLSEYVEELPEYALYGAEGKFAVKLIPSGKKPGFLSRLLGAAQPSCKLQFSAPVAYELSTLQDVLSSLIDADDDCMTQYHEAEVLKFLLMKCRTFEEILAWGCITGSVLTTGHNTSLPELCEDAFPNLVDDEADELALISAPDYEGPLSIQHIRRMAALIVADDLAQELSC